MKILLFSRSPNNPPISEIEDHLERSNARIEQAEQAEAQRECRKLIRENIRLAVGVTALLCAISAIYSQF
ncbi:MAG: hypothetical protein M3T96_11230 [Acidobacteriota bacterium]|nr:hypothetical protein [Acidobacteriota bacterium]